MAELWVYDKNGFKAQNMGMKHQIRGIEDIKVLVRKDLGSFGVGEKGNNEQWLSLTIYKVAGLVFFGGLLG